MKNVLIIEDHFDASEAMGNVISKAFADPVIDKVSNLGDAHLAITEKIFDLIVLDLNLPDGNGEEFILEILKVQPNAYVVISTIHDESERLLRALEYGAKGYLLKEQSKDALVNEFQGIMQGKPPLAPAVTRRMLDFIRNQRTDEVDSDGMHLNHPTPVHNPGLSDSGITPDEAAALADIHLTGREEEVLRLLAKGFSRPEVAGFLNISKHTVATHISKIYQKIGASSRSEAALIARQLGIL